MFGFGRRRSAPQLTDDIRRTIFLLDEQRRLAADTASRALVTRAEVQRACHVQLQTLAAAADVAENAETLARRAAGSAGRDPASDAAAFEQAATALHSVREVLGAAAGPVNVLLASASHNGEQARQVLGRARGALLEQIRVQLRLLRALERAEQARIVAEARRQR